MWKQNPEVLCFDNTYKTNRFNMPLHQINGVICLHTTFCVSFAVMSNEKEEWFAWVLDQLLKLAANEAINLPYVILSDFDLAFKNAAGNAFPDTSKHQMCLWHIMKNVAHNVKKKWTGPLEGAVLRESGGGAGSNLKHRAVNNHETEGETDCLDNDPVAQQTGFRLLEPEDRAQV